MVAAWAVTRYTSHKIRIRGEREAEMADTGDSRELNHAPQASPPGGETRLRWNPVTGDYLGQAPARMQRRELTDACPFCADLTSGHVSPGTQAWIRPNDFPAIRPPTGEAYILIYSADHDRTFAELDVPDVL